MNDSAHPSLVPQGRHRVDTRRATPEGKSARTASTRSLATPRMPRVVQARHRRPPGGAHSPSPGPAPRRASPPPGTRSIDDFRITCRHLLFIRGVVAIAAKPGILLCLNSRFWSLACAPAGQRVCGLPQCGAANPGCSRLSGGFSPELAPHSTGGSRSSGTVPLRVKSVKRFNARM